MDATRTFYHFAYRIGFHPWEDLADHPPFADTLAELIARDEAGREPPFGRALDLGCGSGIWGVRLAERGWQVTGIDMVPGALRRARRRAAAAGVNVRYVKGDVTDLRGAGIEPGNRLVLDTGTFHGLTPDQRTAMARQVDAIAADDATVLLDCFAPGRRGPLPRGVTRGDVEAAFGGWKITDVVVADTEPDALAVRLNFEERFYRLCRE
jgi:SAM-dependent methyltransferase